MVRRRTEPAPDWPADPTSATGAGRADPALVPRHRAAVHGVEIDDESVLYDERNDRLHFLNWSASAVWWAIDGRANVDELAGTLAQRFHAESEVMRTDVLALLGVLGEQHLVEVVPGRGGHRG